MSVLQLFSRFLDGVKTLGLGVTLQAALYPYRKAFYTARLSSSFPKSHPGESAAGASPGRVLAHQKDGTHIDLICENALTRIDVLAADLIRVRVSSTGRLAEPFSYAIAKPGDAWPAAPWDMEETPDTLLVRTEKLCCIISKSSLNISFLDPDGTVINSDKAGIGWQGETVFCRKHLSGGEHVYGLGQKTTALDKRGLALDMWNADPQFYHPGRDPIYSNIPFYLGVKEGRGYGILFDTSTHSRFDFGAGSASTTCFQADWPLDGEIRYYFFYGPRLVDVLNRYTELTGRMIMPPLWALGYHQNRWSYYPASRVREIAAEFRRRRIPCEAIHLDIDYMDGFRCFTWDRKRFPDPAQLIADLHADGYKVVTMIDPGIKKDRRYWVYQDGLKNDVFCKYPDGRLFSGPVWPGECVFPDFTSPRVRAWWGELYRGMVDLGIDGFWNDMNEPVIFGQHGDTFPDAVQHEYESHAPYWRPPYWRPPYWRPPMPRAPVVAPADHRAAHNVYGMQMARASAEGLMRLRPNERPLVISRSVWAGTQRYNMHWLGDNFSDWESLRNTMPLVLNMGLSGIALTGPDTGGFAGNSNSELLIRWNQMSTFLPFFRNHSAKNTADQEPWVFGEPCESISRQFIELRYRLLPYTYTAFWQSAQAGLPMARPLFLAFQDDRHTCNIEDEFMFGDAFLVAPVCEPGAISRRLYIPAGRWYDFWTGALTAGPQITRLDAPLERIPLLVRAGSIVPMWPLMQHTGEHTIDTLILHVYPGNGISWLYEDDGHTWDFQQGHYRLTQLICELDGREQAPHAIRVRQLIDHPTTNLPACQRIQVHIHGLPAAPRAATIDNQPVKAAFDPSTHTLSLETGPFNIIQAVL